MKKRLFSIAAAVCAALLPAASQAKDEWPTDTVKIIVPFTAGGTTDIFARVIGDHLQKTFGKPFIIENVPGAGSVTGIAQVARAKPDGLTIGIASTSGLAINPLLRPDQIPYKPLKDLIPVAMFDRVPNVLVINQNKLNVKTVPELIDYLKKNPGKVAYGSSGVGTSQHLAAELFQQMTGTKMTHVPYPGSARIGLHPGQSDWGYVLIRLGERLGLIRDVQTPETLGARRGLSRVSSAVALPVEVAGAAR